MKKKLLSFILFFTVMLTGCNKGSNKAIDFLNNNDCYAYLFGGLIDDDYGMKNYKRVSSLNEINISGNFCVIIDVPSYINYLDNNYINNLYGMLEEDNKAFIMFYNAENYDFFKGTVLANEKDYYNNVSLIKSFNNFYGQIIEKDFSSNIKSLKMCLETYAREFKSYMGSL